MALEVMLQDRFSQRLHRFWHFSDLEVTDPLNDAMTARLVISLYNRGAEFVQAGQTMLRVTYQPDGYENTFLVFKGVVMRPIVDFDAGTMEINAHCQGSLAAKRTYLRYGDIAVDAGYSLDGAGARMILESTIPTPYQLAGGVVPHGFTWGLNDTTDIFDKALESGGEPGDFIRKAQRGSNVWETLTNMSQVVGGPDFRFRPVDYMHEGINGVPEPGYTSEVDFFDHMGMDLSKEIVFEHGRSADNIIWEPDFDMVRNSFTVVRPGGQRSRTDELVGRYKDTASFLDYGIMEGWESGGQNDTQTVLNAKAQAWVQTYSQPPNFFTIAPANDRPGAHVLYDQYNLGDTVSARAKKGYVEVDVTGRIVKTTLKQQGQDGATIVALDCVPTVVVSGDTGDSG